MATPIPEPRGEPTVLGARFASALQRATAGSPPPFPKSLPTTPPPFPTAITPDAAAERNREHQALRLLNQAELERFKNLIVFAKTTVESQFSGRHKSPDLGSGGEFAEYQAYLPGLPVHAIDWRIYARTRKLVIRRYREETDMDVHLLVDASGSMDFLGGGSENKGRRAARIAAALAYLMMKQGDKASLTLFADRVVDHLPAGGGQRHLLSALRSLVRPAYGATGLTDLPGAITECSRLYKRRGRLVILSDFLGHDPAEIFDALGPLIHRGFAILLMQILDPEERTLPDAPLARFVDMETGESIEVEPAEIRDAYAARVHERCESLAADGAKHRVEFTSLGTESPYREAIESYLGFRTAKN
ncbi:DUF58 domain-containing protein [Luteolibacter arcticus]|uniref:DUF58 domain-containing protein n=1 Tax=Luteolibacter arcticus TaxID=1581411 RepID=A0ABT3GJQ1_9BACT|nr:DUF58 domain-containing protein [Luteolibacter arcticus]MCW1923728.1 DUF58 domain-containing protein [Luteolibacter arcticus]